MTQRPQETLRQLSEIFPDFEASWAEEEAPPEDGLVDGVYYEWTHHAVMHNFLAYFSCHQEQFTVKQLRDIGKWMDRAASEDDDLANAVSTCFLEHARQVGVNGILWPHWSRKTKDYSHP
jgi:hypothetical protein